MVRMRSIITKYALQNAVFYGGRANPRAVLGKVLGSEPSLRGDAAQVRVEVDNIVSDINRLTLDVQRARLAEIDPDMLTREQKKQDELPPLPEAAEGRVVTRFAPSPTGPLNIAHLLRAAMMNYLYARKYSGRFILRLEDTDAEKIEKRYYKAIQDDLKSAGISWDRLCLESDDMELYCQHARTLVREGKAYMCTCPAERFRELKLRRQNCPCRETSAVQNLEALEKAIRGGYREGQIVMRLKTSMQDPNPAIRDPPLMRVSLKSHPLKKRRYSFWPLYNFANAVEDNDQGVTHVFRGKEHEHNTDTQRRIYQALGWKPPVTINFGMIYLPGEKLHTRDIREMIKSGKVSGWDDPRLHTVQALLRRGFQPEAFRLYAIQVGLTKTDIRMNWDNLESFNRTIIDSMANRYMLIKEPARISVRDAPPVKSVQAELHPDDPSRGKREIPVSARSIFIEKEDLMRFRGKVVRLKGLFNVRLRDSAATFAGTEVSQDMPKLHWASSPNIKAELVMPGHRIRCLAEPAASNLKKGDLLQMERVGYGRVDAKSPVLRIIWTHR